MNTTSMNYLGRAKLSLEYNNKKIIFFNHNEGKEILFKAFARFLTGDSQSLNFVPKYFDLVNSNSDSVLSSRIALTGKSYYQASDNWVAKFTASIPANHIVGSFSKAQLLDKEFNVLAELDVSEIDIESLPRGSYLLAEWEMLVKNNIQTVENDGE